MLTPTQVGLMCSIVGKSKSMKQWVHVSNNFNSCYEMWTSWWAFTKWRGFSSIKQSRAKVPRKPAHCENSKNKVVILSVTASLPPRARGPSMKTSGSARPWRTHGQDHPIAGSTKRSKTRTQQQLLQSKSQLSGQATNREPKTMSVLYFAQHCSQWLGSTSWHTLQRSLMTLHDKWLLHSVTPNDGLCGV